MARQLKREQGSSIIEVMAATFVLVISLTGMMATVVIQRTTEATSNRLWKATDGASSAMEDIRADSLENWTGINDWDQHKVDTEGLRDRVHSRLETSVSSDASKLDNSEGMWAVGATAPSFYLVQVGAELENNEFSNALNIQTYVADRGGLVGRTLGGAPAAGGGSESTGGDQSTPPESGTPAGGGGGAGGGGSGGEPAVAQADRLQADPVGVAVSGSKSDALSFTVTNASTESLGLVSVSVNLGDGKLKYALVEVGGEVFFEDVRKPSNATTISAPTGETALPPGDIEIQIIVDKKGKKGKKAKPPFLKADKPVTVTLNFTDGSAATFVAQQ